MTKLLLKKVPGEFSRQELTITLFEALEIIKGLSSLIVSGGGAAPSVSAGVNGQRASFCVDHSLKGYRVTQEVSENCKDRLHDYEASSRVSYFLFSVLAAKEFIIRLANNLDCKKDVLMILDVNLLDNEGNDLKFDVIISNVY